MTFRVRGAVYTLLLLVMAAGCGNGASDRGGTAANQEYDNQQDMKLSEGSPAGPVKGGRLVIGMQQEPEILNEAVNTMVAGIYVCNLLFSKFVKHNDRMELVADLLTEIPTVENGGISSDYLTYTYHLRKDARWHDGVLVTSKDVVFTYELMMHPDVNVETRQGWDIIERVETPDSFTVVFHLSEVYANFAGDCFYDESVLPHHLLGDKLGIDFQSADFHRHPVGSGPFVFHEWMSGSHIVVRANEDYYGEGPYLDEIVIRFIPDGNALLVQLEAGEIMAVDNAPNALLGVLSSVPGVTIHRNPALFNEHLDCNCESPALADRRVRKALAMAVDRKQISEKIYDGVWIPAFSDEHPSSPYHTDVGERELSYDPVRAGKLLTEAGWIDTDGDGIRDRGGVSLTLAISTTAGRRNRERTEVVLAEQYRAIGVELKIRNYHPAVLFASYDEGGILKRGAFDLALYAFLAPPDPSTKEGSYSAAFIPPTGQNFSRINDERLTELLSKGSKTVSFERRKAIYDEIAEILALEVPIIPLLWVTQLDAMPNTMHGYRANPTQSGDTWNANEWWIEK